MAFTNQVQHRCLAFLFIICFSQAFCRQLDDEKTMSKVHAEWMDRFERVYKDSQDKDRRYAIFKDNVKFIEDFNKNMGRNYTLSINEFADLTNEEFRAIRNGYKKVSSKVITSNSLKGTSFKYGNATNVPSSVDWRKKGAVTAIKDQGTCGSCWAFSAVAATEGIHQLKTRNLIPLSEQELVDCDTGDEDQGCQGGLMDSAFWFIQRNKGLTTEANYPYRGVDGVSCNTRKATSGVVVSITGYEDVPENNESALLQAVANQPVSVAIDASGPAFQFYSSGVFTGTCGTNLDHGVTVVGYGTSSDGTKYWLVKNSWGANWGENGYVRMQRGVPAKEGLCGIAMLASYPTA